MWYESYRSSPPRNSEQAEKCQNGGAENRVCGGNLMGEATVMARKRTEKTKNWCGTGLVARDLYYWVCPVVGKSCWYGFQSGKTVKGGREDRDT